MTEGRIARRLLEMASADLRSVFRRDERLARISCLLGVVALEDGKATIQRLRLETPVTTLVAGGHVDVAARRLDITVKSIASSTGFFALDIPIRVTGRSRTPASTRWSANPRAGSTADRVATSRTPSRRGSRNSSPAIAARGSRALRRDARVPVREALRQGIHRVHDRRHRDVLEHVAAAVQDLQLDPGRLARKRDAMASHDAVAIGHDGRHRDGERAIARGLLGQEAVQPGHVLGVGAELRRAEEQRQRRAVDEVGRRDLRPEHRAQDLRNQRAYEGRGKARERTSSADANRGGDTSRSLAPGQGCVAPPTSTTPRTRSA